MDVALGPKGAFEHESVGTLKRRVTADRVVNVATDTRRPAKPPKQPQTPRVVELLRKAQESLQRDMEWLARFALYQRPGRLADIHPSPEAAEAARRLIELLTTKPEE